MLIILAGVMAGLQRKMLFFPERYSLQRAEERAGRLGLQLWPSREEPWGYLGGDAGGRAGTALVFHGNAGAALDRSYYCRDMGALGWRVVLLEYPGYGPRPEPPVMDEATLSADGRRAVKRAVQDFGGQVVVVGESLGAGVASAVLAEVPEEVRGAALITPWDTLPNTVRALYGAPASWLVSDCYDSVENLKPFGRPVAFAIAQRDEVIAPKLGDALYRSYEGPKRRWTFSETGHNGWQAVVDEAWWREVMEFVVGGGATAL